jgi:hypothetical protein
VFGASQPVLRMTALGFALAGLLLFMLWTDAGSGATPRCSRARCSRSTRRGSS